MSSSNSPATTSSSSADSNPTSLRSSFKPPSHYARKNFDKQRYLQQLRRYASPPTAARSDGTRSLGQNSQHGQSNQNNQIVSSAQLCPFSAKWQSQPDALGSPALQKQIFASQLGIEILLLSGNFRSSLSDRPALTKRVRSSSPNQRGPRIQHRQTTRCSPIRTQRGTLWS